MPCRSSPEPKVPNEIHERDLYHEETPTDKEPICLTAILGIWMAAKWHQPEATPETEKKIYPRPVFHPHRATQVLVIPRVNNLPRFLRPDMTR